MSKLRKSAKGQDCQFRFPGVCNFNTETTVGAHIRIKGLCGVAKKPSDLLLVWACSDCHNVQEQPCTRPPHISEAELNKYILDGLCRTLVANEIGGLIKIV